MPLLVVAIAFVAVAVLAVALMPVMLVQRYRIGTRRQPARRWLLTINLVGLVLSASMFLTGAAITSVWVPGALRYSLLGMAIGALAGIAGLALTRWDAQPSGLYFTPFRPLVFLIVFLVSARLLYGFWRMWHAWNTLGAADDWAATAGVPQSMGAGALVIGYYLLYWAGVRRRYRRHQVR